MSPGARRASAILSLMCALLASGALAAYQAAPPEEARVQLQRGAEHLRRNENEQAVRDLKAAVALDPHSAAAQANGRTAGSDG